MVFRRLATPADFAQAYRLLGAGGPRPADEVWFGLWNLTAADGDALAAIAATRPSSPRVVEVRAVKTRQGYAVRARLLRELADTCRADGVEWLLADAGRPGADVLRRHGFAPATDPDGPPIRPGWLALQV
jgi:GNAT superfamily N-acetyltransferase